MKNKPKKPRPLKNADKILPMIIRDLPLIAEHIYPLIGPQHRNPDDWKRIVGLIDIAVFSSMDAVFTALASHSLLTPPAISKLLRLRAKVTASLKESAEQAANDAFSKNNGKSIGEDGNNGGKFPPTPDSDLPDIFDPTLN